MPRPLKIFQAHLGFYDTVVAVPSRAAALRAWGSRQDMFRDGLASEAQDPQAIAAALAKPGVVLRRAAGSNAAFSENPGLPQVPKGSPRKQAPVTKPQPTPPKPAQPPRLRLVPKPVAEPASRREKPRPPPDRKPLERAEKAIADVKRAEQRALAAIKKKKAALDEQEQRLRSDFRKRLEKAEKAVDQARKAYQHALSRS